MRVGIIDLGTNTFNLLIADVHAGGYSIIVQTKIGVALGMGGINSNTIAVDAVNRACEAFTSFLKKGNELGVERWNGIATSAVRDAKNGVEFAEMLTNRFGIPVKIIDGIEEAELIYNGVSWNNALAANAIIMDIGGGSTEFIQVNENKISQLCSLNIGVSRVFQQQLFSDPLTKADQAHITNWFELQSEPLNSFQHGGRLIGASGSFETFYEMIHQSSFDTSLGAIAIDLDALQTELDWIIQSNFTEREQHPWIIPIRRKLAPIAALKTKWILQKLEITEFILSPYSLKEGLLRQIINEKNQ